MNTASKSLIAKSSVSTKKAFPFLITAAMIQIAVFMLMDVRLTQNDPDTFWHLEIGREMIRQGAVIGEAIHTFAGDRLPYVPHEAGFQWILALLYNIGEWKGVHLLTLGCVVLLSFGLYRLAQISRQETGLPELHTFIPFVLIPFLVFYIYTGYFTIRPQMLSAGLIVWFAVWMRQLNMKSGYGSAAMLGLISFLLANLHAGVWPVIVVLFGMQLLDRTMSRSLNRYDLAGLLLIVAGGLLNPGGPNNILYFLTVSNSGFADMIMEWKPIGFSEDLVTYFVIVAFVLCASVTVTGNRFRLLLFIGMLYLGLSNYKQHLMLLLFLPYFAAPAVERLCWSRFFAPMEMFAGKKAFGFILAAGFIVNFGYTLGNVYEQPVKDMPVQEMDYILQQTAAGQRPKVLSDYGTSGYVMFRGGDVLADGRFDPFILEQTKGIHGWTAFERSVHGYGSGFLTEIIAADRPEFLIVPHANDKENKLTRLRFEQATRQLPPPVFTGAYGVVWDLRKAGERK